MKSPSSSLLGALLSRILSISRRTWIFLSVTFLVIIGLLIWAAISTAGWLFGMARDSVNAAPEAVRAASAQVEQVMPGVQEKLGVLLPGLKPEAPLREVSGTDPAPVARFPGLARVQWQRDEQQVRVRYQGRADLADVLKHYTQGFTALGYKQSLLSASPSEERHEFFKDGEHFDLVFSLADRDVVTIDLSSHR